MLRGARVRKLLPAGVVSGVLLAAVLLPAAPLAAVFAGYAYGYGGVLWGGASSNGPAAAAREDVFVRGQDLGLWTANFTPGGTWSGWSTQGGVLEGDPGSAGNATTGMVVFVAGQDGAEWYKTYNGTTWTGWTSIGGHVIGGPGVATGATNGEVDLFVRGEDNAVYWKVIKGGIWTASWANLGGIVTSDISAITTAPNHIDITARGNDGAVWVKSSVDDGATWTNWFSAGGLSQYGPTLSSCGASKLDLWVVGVDPGQGLWHKGWAGTGFDMDWNSWGGHWSADLGATCRTGSTTVDVYGRGQDNALWSWV